MLKFESLLKVKEKVIKITIRDAKVSDAHPIGSAQREIAKTPGFFCSIPDELTDENVEKTILKCLHAKNGVYLVAECEGRIVGHSFLEPLSPSSLQHIAELNIVVHLGWQRQGIDTLLIEKLLEKASHTEIEKIALSVRASNAHAISLYKAIGFREEGRLKNHVKTKGGYFDDILMALNIKEKKPSSTFIIRVLQEKDISILSETFTLVVQH